MSRVGQDEFLAPHAADVLIEIVRTLRVCRMIVHPMHDQNGCRHPCDLSAEDGNDIHHLMDGDERHTPISIVRPLRHVLQLAARLGHIAIDARFTRRQMLDPLLRRDHDRCTETDDVGCVRLNREQHSKDRTHRVPDDGDHIACAAEDGVAVAHRVHPVLMLHTAQILGRRPMPREPYREHGKAALIQILPHEAQLRRQPCEAVNEEHAMPPARQQKRLRAL